MSDAALHELIHQLLATGRLPSDHANAVHAGYGKGETCNACGKSMPASTVVYEVNVGTGAAPQVFALHLKCFEVWRSERERFRSHGSDPAA